MKKTLYIIGYDTRFASQVSLFSTLNSHDNLMTPTINLKQHTLIILFAGFKK